MRLRQIQDFLAVIEEGSIHAAARKSGLSQPAVTKSLRGLEAELHAQLVRRTNHGVVATPAGRAFYAHAHAAQAELRKGEEEIAQLAGEGSGFSRVRRRPVGRATGSARSRHSFS